MTASAWQRAAAFAARAHSGQFRKDKRTPYVAHPFRVALVVRHVFECDDEATLCAALLHDTIEDTTVDFDELDYHFGSDVADLVAVLSKDMRQREPEREAAYDAALAASPWRARLIKLADVYDNLADVEQLKNPWGAIEKAERALTCAGDAPELARAREVVQGYASEVEERLRRREAALNGD